MNLLNYESLSLFPSIIQALEIENFDNRELVKAAYELRSKDEGVQKSNRGGWHSNALIISQRDTPINQILIDMIGSFPNMKSDWKQNLYLYAWININGPGNFNVPHIHPGCDVSGVFWVKCPKNSGDIEFTNPHEFIYNKLLTRGYKDEFKEQTNFKRHYRIRPQEGTMLLFPSSLEHSVDENESTEDRISISFNINF